MSSFGLGYPVGAADRRPCPACGGRGTVRVLHCGAGGHGPRPGHGAAVAPAPIACGPALQWSSDEPCAWCRTTGAVTDDDLAGMWAGGV